HRGRPRGGRRDAPRARRRRGRHRPGAAPPVTGGRKGREATAYPVGPLGSRHRPPEPVDPMDRSRFPLDPWRLVETAYDREDLGVTETLFSVSNGYLGMRGNVEEGRDTHTHGTYVNGFHETWDIH